MHVGGFVQKKADCKLTMLTMIVPMKLSHMVLFWGIRSRFGLRHTFCPLKIIAAGGTTEEQNCRFPQRV